MPEDTKTTDERLLNTSQLADLLLLVHNEKPSGFSTSSSLGLFVYTLAILRNCDNAYQIKFVLVSESVQQQLFLGKLD